MASAPPVLCHSTSQSRSSVGQCYITRRKGSGVYIFPSLGYFLWTLSLNILSGYSPGQFPWTFPLDIPPGQFLLISPPGHFPLDTSSWTSPSEYFSLDIFSWIPLLRHFPWVLLPGHFPLQGTSPWTFPPGYFSLDISRRHFPWIFLRNIPLTFPPRHLHCTFRRDISPGYFPLDIPPGYFNWTFLMDISPEHFPWTLYMGAHVCRIVCMYEGLQVCAWRVYITIKTSELFRN